MSTQGLERVGAFPLADAVAGRRASLDGDDEVRKRLPLGTGQIQGSLKNGGRASPPAGARVARRAELGARVRDVLNPVPVVHDVEVEHRLNLAAVEEEIARMEVAVQPRAGQLVKSPQGKVAHQRRVPLFKEAEFRAGAPAGEELAELGELLLAVRPSAAQIGDSAVVNRGGGVNRSGGESRAGRVQVGQAPGRRQQFSPVVSSAHVMVTAGESG